MFDWRSTKRRARRVTHETMGVPALYYVRRDMTPQAVTVRLHMNFGVAGAKGIEEGFAKMLDTTPRIRFDRGEVEMPEAQGIVSVAPGEAYLLGAAYPPDDQYIYVTASPLPVSQTEGLAVPRTPGC